MCVNMCKYVKGRGREGRRERKIEWGLSKYSIKWMVCPKAGRGLVKIISRDESILDETMVVLSQSFCLVP